MGPLLAPVTRRSALRLRVSRPGYNRVMTASTVTVGESGLK